MTERVKRTKTEFIEKRKELESQIIHLQNEYVLFLKEQATSLRETYPVVYVIREVGYPTNENYIRFENKYGCFTNRKTAEKYCSKNRQGSHHTLSYSVVAEASENLEDYQVIDMDEPPRKCGYDSD